MCVMEENSKRDDVIMGGGTLICNNNDIRLMYNSSCGKVCIFR